MFARTLSAARIQGTRGFAKAAKKAAKADNKLPKELYGVHGRYASALFLSAQSSKSLDKVEKELNVSTPLFFLCVFVCQRFFGWIQVGVGTGRRFQPSRAQICAMWCLAGYAGPTWPAHAGEVREEVVHVALNIL